MDLRQAGVREGSCCPDACVSGIDYRKTRSLMLPPCNRITGTGKKNGSKDPVFSISCPDHLEPGLFSIHGAREQEHKHSEGAEIANNKAYKKALRKSLTEKSHIVYVLLV